MSTSCGPGFGPGSVPPHWALCSDGRNCRSVGTGGCLQRGRGRKGLSLGEQHLGSVSLCIPIPTPDCRLLEVSILNTWDLNPLQRLTQYNPRPMTKHQKRKVPKSPAPLPSIPPRRGSGDSVLFLTGLNPPSRCPWKNLRMGHSSENNSREKISKTVPAITKRPEQKHRLAGGERLFREQ